MGIFSQTIKASIQTEVPIDHKELVEILKRHGVQYIWDTQIVTSEGGL